jgi:hypothetical protein
MEERYRIKYKDYLWASTTRATSGPIINLLFNSDVLMFDRQTGSLWSQLGLKSVAGEFVGTELNTPPARARCFPTSATATNWKSRHGSPASSWTASPKRTMKIGYITGSGFYDLHGFEENSTKNRFA